MPVKLSEDALKKLDLHGLCIAQDRKVMWRDDASAHPKNWSVRRKLYDTGVITFFVTLSAMVGNVGTSVAREAVSDLGISSVLANIAFASMFFFGQGVGGLILPPYTESFGRKTTNMVATAGYAIACIVVGAPQSLPAVIVGRFLSGFISALPTVVGLGMIEDMWDVRARIWAVDIWIKGSIVGIALAPCMATYVSLSNLHWPWVFYLSAILSAVICFLCFWTQESRPSVLLSRQVENLQRETNIDDLETENQDKVPDFSTFAHTMLIRPINWFFTEPIVCVVALMSGIIFSSLYLQTEGLAVTYKKFGFDAHQASLVYIAWIIGLILTIPLRFNDWRIVSRRLRRNEKVRPEDKIIGFYVAAPVLAAALWWFAWTVPPTVGSISPFVSMAALVLVGACVNEFDGILQGYLTDSYTAYAASANAPLAFLRAMLSASFPIFRKQMFTNLGSNIASTILAIIATLFCGIAYWFMKNRARCRERSKYATSMEDVEDEKDDDQ